MAIDGKNGKELWSFNLGTPQSGGIISFAVDGKQYVAVAAGGTVRSQVWFGKEPKWVDALKVNFSDVVDAGTSATDFHAPPFTLHSTSYPVSRPIPCQYRTNVPSRSSDSPLCVRRSVFTGSITAGATSVLTCVVTVRS